MDIDYSQNPDSASAINQPDQQTKSLQKLPSPRKKLIIFFGIVIAFLLGGVLVIVLLFTVIFSKAIKTQNDISKSVSQVSSNKKTPVISVTPDKKHDYSRIVAFAGSKAIYHLTNKNGKDVGTSYLEGPIADEVTGKTNGDGMMTFDYVGPDSGDYVFRVENIGKEGVIITLYDREFNDKSFDFFKDKATSSAKFKIVFNKENSLSSKAQIVQ